MNLLNGILFHVLSFSLVHVFLNQLKWDTDFQDYTDFILFVFLELIVINSRKKSSLRDIFTERFAMKWLIVFHLSLLATRPGGGVQR